MASRDRGFCRKLVATTLRRLGQIDTLLNRAMDRPGALKQQALRHLLRLAVTQLIFLRTPPHAAISTTLALMQRNRKLSGFKGFANAVLRRVARDGASWLNEAADETPPPLPAWLFERLTAYYGAETAWRIAEAHLREPPLDLTLMPGNQPESLAKTLGGDILPTGSLRLWDSGDVGALPGYEAGQWWVQDAAAALPAKLLGTIAGRAVIDLCAAPGGKTAQLCAAGATVTAIDRSARRLERLSQNLARLGLMAQTIAADATGWRPEQAVDGVLLDAPCTATGTLRRHPDIPYLKDGADVKTLATLQAKLLDAAIAMVKPGGHLVYATCSLLPEEGEQQIEAALRRAPDTSLDPIKAGEVAGLEDGIAARGWFRTLPCQWSSQGGIDGFFMARLVKGNA